MRTSAPKHSRPAPSPAATSGPSYARIQPKLAVSTPAEGCEQEAERIADGVMHMPDSERPSALASSGAVVLGGRPADTAVPPLVDEVLRSPGQPLDASTHTFMASRFGHDFSRVRVHADSRASEAAEAVRAMAFTGGHDIVFGAGQYRPETAAGKRLLAHELAHVVQQAAPAGASGPSVLYRQPVPATTPIDPKFSIVGAPDVTAVPSGQEINSHSQVAVNAGTFTLDARVEVDAPNTATLKDWEVGTLQMTSGTVDASCYQRPGGANKAPGQPVFVERMHPPTQMFHPDRDPSSPVFTDARGTIDLGAFQGGSPFVVRPHVEDHPGWNTWAFASAHTQKSEDTDVEIVRHRHRGFFYTYVVARQKTTGRLIPLYLARWWMGADFGYIHPDRTLGFQAVQKDSLTFRLIKAGLFSARDFFPVVTGVTTQKLSAQRLKEWRTECPGFVELGGGQ